MSIDQNLTGGLKFNVMPFSYNAVELCVVIINEKPWTRAREACLHREACSILEYGKATKAALVIKAHASPEYYNQLAQGLEKT